MPAHIDTLELASAFERAGLNPSTASGIARAIQDIAMRNTTTQNDLDKALHLMTVRIGLMIASGLGITIAALGTLIALLR